MTKLRKKSLAVLTGTACLTSVSLAQTISSVSPTNPTKSGLVRVFGTGFGSASTGTIQISGQRAPIARWTDTLIEFYVPEATPATDTKVLLSQPAGQKAIFVLSVRDRQLGQGRFKWRFEAADQYIVNRPALGADGTIYAIGNFGHLYAIAPNGALKWLYSNGADGCVDVGPDGTIYTGRATGVQAFSPDGLKLWQYNFNSSIMAGPSVGPDGLIYAADNARWNANPTGAVVLSPTGEELWRGGVFFGRGGTRQTEVQFDSNRAFIWSQGDLNTGAIGGLHAIQLGGGFDWVNGDIVGFQPSGYAAGGVVAHGTSTTQRMTTNGSTLWAFDLWSIGGSQPDEDIIASPDGGAFFLTKNTRLNGLNPNGTLRFSNLLGGIPSNLTRSPNGSKLLLQRADNFGQPNRLEAYHAVSGAFLWRSENLPIEGGMPIGAYIRMKFTPAGDTLFFGTAGPMLSANTATSYVYAMNAG